MITSAVFLGTVTAGRLVLLAYMPVDGPGATIRAVHLCAGAALAASTTDYWVLRLGPVVDQVFSTQAQIPLQKGLQAYPQRFKITPKLGLPRAGVLALSAVAYGSPGDLEDVSLVLEYDTL